MRAKQVVSSLLIRIKTCLFGSADFDDSEFRRQLLFDKLKYFLLQLIYSLNIIK